MVCNSRRRGFALIEILVVVIIIGLLVGAYFGLRGRSSATQPQERFPGEAQTIPGKAIQKGESVECMTNLQQLRSCIEMYRIENDANPPQLDPSWGIALQCPVSGYLYQYDPQTGQVKCTTPGHQKY